MSLTKENLDKICGYCGEPIKGEIHDHLAEIQAEQAMDDEEYIKDYLNR